MATGGQQNAGKEICQNGEPSNNGNSHSERPMQWTLLPNNLELGTRSKPAKKQRNKDKSRSAVTAQNLSSSDASKLFDSLIQSFSDIDIPPVSKRNVKAPVNQRPSTSSFQSVQSSSRTAMENENKKLSKEEYMKKHTDAIQERYAHLRECQSQVDSVLQRLEESDDPGCGDIGQGDNELAPYPVTDDVDGREMNGSAMYYSEEETANIQNHLLEKMKASQEKLAALRDHQSLLLSMQKKAEDKLAAFQAQVAESNADMVADNQEWRFSPKITSNSGNSNKMSVNGDLHWENENMLENQPSQWPAQNSSKPSQNNQQKVLENGLSDVPQDLSRLHVNLDHIKRRLELLQQLSNQSTSELEPDKNTADHASMQEDLEENITVDRRAAIEWERKKLKNTLMELQEKQKVNEVLKKQLLLLKDAASAVEYKGEESSFPLANIQDIQPPYSEENIRTLEDLRETIGQLRRMLNTRSMSSASNEDSNIAPVNFSLASPPQDNSTKVPPHLGSCAKRDNIRKEQRNQFPARRHYEAEGRANEDSDVPAVPTAVPSPPPDPNAWENDAKIQEKKRKLEATKRKLQLMQNLVNSIQEARNSGQQVPAEFLQVLSTFSEEDDDEEEEEEEDEVDFDDDDNTVTDNEDSQENGDSNIMAVKNKPPEVPPTRVKERANDAFVPISRYSESDRAEATERANTDEVQNLEQLKSERERLVKLHEKFIQLQHKFSSSPKQNNESMRCSGEGGNLQDKKSQQVAPASPVGQMHPRRLRQTNLLTRQNVATVESQNRNNSTNVAKVSGASLKKDNINDLSAKLVKPGTPRTSADPLNKYNTDAMSSYCTDFLKHDKNKPQNYARRDNHIHSNSSVNSEPLEGSSRSLAPDTTVAATWGGSSTQENFEDENEPESLEEQEEEEEEEGSNNEVAGNVSVPDQGLSCEPARYGNEQAYANYSADSSTKRRDNRLHKYFKSTQLNQWSPRKNFPRSEASCNRNQNLPVPSTEYPLEPPQESSQASASSIGSINPMPVPTKFVQQLQQQLDKLNALCRPVLHDPHPSSNEAPSVIPVPVQRSVSGELNSQAPFSYPVPNAYRSAQAPDLMQHYTQQLQLQQQLLLSLSQCYHALYVQQLEIQHLTRCVQQNSDSETGGQPIPSATPSAPSSEDLFFRPWFLAPWLNPAIPPLPFAAGQVSPMSASPFLQPSQAAFTFNPTVGTANPSPAAPCALVTGVQPARAVVHPDRQNSETLNNQVPPRTRANNFWDNFRSQSRQNLLSSSNSARTKDATGHFTSPQVRQVHPVVPNESSWMPRSRVFIPPHTESTSTVTPSERTFPRPPTSDSSFRIACRAKKPNWSRQPANPVFPDSTIGSNRYNMCPETDQSCPSSTVNANIDHQPCGTPTLGSSRTETRFPPPKPRPSAAASASVSEPSFESIETEVAKLLSQKDNMSGYLIEVLRELRNVKSDYCMQRALTAVKELVNTEGAANTMPFPSDNFENSNQNNVATREIPDSNSENIPDGNYTSSSSAGFNDPLPMKNSNESTSQRNNHNWPPATIIPLGKHTSKPCTGAVKKRPVREVVPPIVSSWPQAPPPRQENDGNLPKSDNLENSVTKVMQEVMPFIQSHIADDCSPAFRASFCSKVVDALKNRSNLKLAPDFLLQLQQTLLQMLSRFSNLKLMECESELIKQLSSTLFRELEMCNCKAFIRPSLDEGCDSSTSASSLPKKSAQPDLLPSSSKSFCDLSKLVLPVKEDQEAVDNGVFFSNSGLQEYEIQMGDLFINMPVEDGLLERNTLHEVVRGVVSGGCSPPTSNWPSQAINAEEDMGYECEAEAEAEPEVEASTEADLAEADQSPGQQNSAGPTTSDSWHVIPQATARSSIVSTNSEEIILSENTCFGDASGVLGLSAQVSASGSAAAKEICLDDIPTKLSPLSPDELQKQIAEEQDSNSLLLEVVEEVPLAGNGECPKDPPPYL